MSTNRNSIAPLTPDEFFSMIPGAELPPDVITRLLRSYRPQIEQQLASFTPKLLLKAAKLKAKGARVPDRFLPVEAGPSKEVVLRAVADEYRKLLAARYAA